MALLLNNATADGPGATVGIVAASTIIVDKDTIWDGARAVIKVKASGSFIPAGVMFSQSSASLTADINLPGSAYDVVADVENAGPNTDITIEII